MHYRLFVTNISQTSNSVFPCWTLKCHRSIKFGFNHHICCYISTHLFPETQTQCSCLMPYQCPKEEIRPHCIQMETTGRRRTVSHCMLAAMKCAGIKLQVLEQGSCLPWPISSLQTPWSLHQMQTEPPTENLVSYERISWSKQKDKKKKYNSLSSFLGEEWQWLFPVWKLPRLRDMGTACHCCHHWGCAEEGRGTNGKGEKEILLLVSPRAGWNFSFPQPFVALSLCLWLLCTLVSVAEYLLYHAGRQSRHFSTTSDIRWGRGSKSWYKWKEQYQTLKTTIMQWLSEVFKTMWFLIGVAEGRRFAFCFCLLGLSFRQKAWSLKLGEF